MADFGGHSLTPLNNNAVVSSTEVVLASVQDELPEGFSTVVGEFLDRKERNELLDQWITEEIGLPLWQARVISRGLVPLLGKLAGRAVVDAVLFQYSNEDSRCVSVVMA